jgi:serine/threonine protein kinase
LLNFEWDQLYAEFLATYNVNIFGLDSSLTGHMTKWLVLDGFAEVADAHEELAIVSQRLELLSDGTTYILPRGVSFNGAICSTIPLKSGTQVFPCVFGETGELAVIKSLPNNVRGQREVQLHELAFKRVPRMVVEVITTIISEETLWLLTKKATLSCDDLLSRKDLTDGEVLLMSRRQRDIVERLHQAGIVLGDVKPANFVVDGSGIKNIKVLDFGFSYLIEDAGAAEAMVVEPSGIKTSYGFAAPETRGYSPQLSVAADGYALAMTGKLLLHSPPVPIFYPPTPCGCAVLYNFLVARGDKREAITLFQELYCSAQREGRSVRVMPDCVGFMRRHYPLRRALFLRLHDFVDQYTRPRLDVKRHSTCIFCFLTLLCDCTGVRARSLDLCSAEVHELFTESVVSPSTAVFATEQVGGGSAIAVGHNLSDEIEEDFRLSQVQDGPTAEAKQDGDGEGDSGGPFNASVSTLSPGSRRGSGRHPPMVGLAREEGGVLMSRERELDHLRFALSTLLQKGTAPYENCMARYLTILNIEQ